MTIELTRLLLLAEPDVFAARQRTREAAAALGFDTNDQVRVATAVSELSRAIVAAAHRAILTIGLADEAALGLVIQVRSEDSFAVEVDLATGMGLGAARRLMDSLTVESENPFAVTMTKIRPGVAGRLAPAEVEDLRDALARLTSASPMDELRAQNLELVRTLEQLTAKQDELVRLNGELEETNQGVMAMYSQLSEELEETNRGVVALYAELDERGAQLRAASTAKSRFLASVSHELRSPLNSVLGLSQLLREPDSEPLTVTQAHHIELIEGSAHELLGLVNDLLDLAKAEAGRLDPRPARVALLDLLAELRATMRPLTPPGVEVRVEIDPVATPPATVETDPTLLAQLLRNLLSNALKYTPHGSVVIRVDRPDESSVRIAVNDTGIGIAPEHHELVFEEFFQVRGRFQAAHKSTGLGLAYSRRVAEALHGRLDLESEVGRGSTFAMSIPIAWPAPDGADDQPILLTSTGRADALALELARTGPEGNRS